MTSISWPGGTDPTRAFADLVARLREEETTSGGHSQVDVLAAQEWLNASASIIDLRLATMSNGEARDATLAIHGAWQGLSRMAAESIAQQNGAWRCQLAQLITGGAIPLDVAQSATQLFKLQAQCEQFRTLLFWFSHVRPTIRIQGSIPDLEQCQRVWPLRVQQRQLAEALDSSVSIGVVAFDTGGPGAESSRFLRKAMRLIATMEYEALHRALSDTVSALAARMGAAETPLARDLPGLHEWLDVAAAAHRLLGAYRMSYDVDEGEVVLSLDPMRRPWSWSTTCWGPSLMRSDFLRSRPALDLMLGLAPGGAAFEGRRTALAVAWQEASSACARRLAFAPALGDELRCPSAWQDLETCDRDIANRLATLAAAARDLIEALRPSGEERDAVLAVRSALEPLTRLDQPRDEADGAAEGARDGSVLARFVSSARQFRVAATEVTEPPLWSAAYKSLGLDADFRLFVTPALTAV